MIKVIGWIDYDNFNFNTIESTDEVIDAVVQEIRINGYKFGGDDHENHSLCCPLLSNGKALRLSWRNWGYVMAKAYDLKTEDGNYNYILWYMGEYGIDKRKFPSENKIDFTKVKGDKSYDYEISDDEYHAINNSSFTKIILPREIYDTILLKAFDRIMFYYKGKPIYEGAINEIRFSYLNLEELFIKDNDLNWYIKDDSNYQDLTLEGIKILIKKKYNISSDQVIILSFDTVSDLRNDNEIY